MSSKNILFRTTDIQTGMENSSKYHYKLRPGYKSQELLIEFFKGVDENAFLADVLITIAALDVQLLDVENLWMNDEMLYFFKTAQGNFRLSKDIWHNAFITCEQNQALILAIEQLLQKDEKFEKVEVDFEKYK